MKYSEAELIANKVQIKKEIELIKTFLSTENPSGSFLLSKVNGTEISLSSKLVPDLCKILQDAENKIIEELSRINIAVQ